MIDYYLCSDTDKLKEVIDKCDAIEQILVKIYEDYYIVTGKFERGKLVLTCSSGYINIEDVLGFMVLK